MSSTKPSAVRPPVIRSAPPSPTYPRKFESTDPDFYLRLEQLSLKKLRQEALEARMCELPLKKPGTVVLPAATAKLLAKTRQKNNAEEITTIPPKRKEKKDVRWRTLVRLSYYKAKLCVRLLKTPRASVSTTDLNRTVTVDSGVEIATINKKEENTAPPVRRGRSRSDAFIVRPGTWRPDVSMFIDTSSPATAEVRS